MEGYNAIVQSERRKDEILTTMASISLRTSTDQGDLCFSVIGFHFEVEL
jgi:hypothetical protein